METRDLGFGEDDIEWWMATAGDGLDAELDPSPAFRPFDDDEIQTYVVECCNGVIDQRSRNANRLVAR